MDFNKKRENLTAVPFQCPAVESKHNKERLRLRGGCNYKQHTRIENGTGGPLSYADTVCLSLIA